MLSQERLSEEARGNDKLEVVEGGRSALESHSGEV